MNTSEPVVASSDFETAFRRRTDASNYETTLTPKSETELVPRTTVQNSDLAQTKAPSLVSETFGLRADNSGRPNPQVQRLKHVSTTPDAEVSIPTSTASQPVSSFGSRTVAICATLTLAAGSVLGVVWLSKSNLELRDWRRPAESMIASFLNSSPSVRTTPPAPSEAEPKFTEIVNQLHLVDRELSSLRQDVRLLVNELAQMRKTQEDLMAGQARLAAEQKQRTDEKPLSQKELSKSHRAGSRTQGR